MNLSLHIAKRYLFSKKSHNAINVISLISVCGIAIATMALVCTLSVFNGFTDVVAKTFNAFDPELQVTPTQGKVFDATDPRIQQVKQLAGIDFTSESLEENALLKYEDRQEPIVLKGVSREFRNLAMIDSLLLDGRFELREGDVNNGVIGAGLATMLGVRAGFLSPLEIYVPKRNEKVNMANPATAFVHSEAYVSGVFALNQAKYDDQMLIISIEQMRELLRYEHEVSSLDIKVKAGESIEAVRRQVRDILGSDYLVKDRFEQQEDLFRMVNVEKWVTFLILAIISIIAIFNVVGSLSMLIIEKMDDVKILQSLGANKKLITRIFLLEGWLITFVGGLVGLIIGIIICLIQQYFGILKLGDAGTFVIDAYPVSVQVMDVFLIFLTVGVVGFLAVLYPVNVLRKKL
ncbi:MAG: ABC transporter permease [Dysgonomonas sp.]